MEISKENYNEACKTMIKKACEDEKYRSLCLSDPESALKEVEGVDIPEGLKLTFVEKIVAGGDQSVLPKDNEVVVELTEKDFYRVMYMGEGGRCIVSTYEFEPEDEGLGEHDWDTDDVG